jgi:hypothetical protein
LGGELSSHLPLSPSKLDDAAKTQHNAAGLCPVLGAGRRGGGVACLAIEEERESWKSRSLPPWSKANRPLRSEAWNGPW